MTTDEERVALDLSDIFSEFENQKKECWGCGLILVLPSSSPVFKCGWCGAVTDNSGCMRKRRRLRWRRLRDKCFILILLGFMIFVICGGVWAIYPILFSRSLFFGVFNCIIAFILSVITLSTFGLAAFQHAGVPPSISWGSYPNVLKGALEGFTFCNVCLKPKSPITHHCHSCGSCILDMDHHCPFIGNCVGAGNHRWFILFLLSAVTSATYVSFMSIYTISLIQPWLYNNNYPSPGFISTTITASTFFYNHPPTLANVKHLTTSLFTSPFSLLSPRALLLFYLLFATLSLNIGLVVLLWQQLFFIYCGNTYLSHLGVGVGDGSGGGRGSGRDCYNLVRFFRGIPISPHPHHVTKKC